MAHKRDLVSSELFHVLNRGADRQDIVWSDRDRERFVGSVGRRSVRHGVAVLAYALMSNHYHLIVDIADGDLASMMCEFQAEHARFMNRRLDRTGPLFERRYVSVPITSDAQLVATVRYVHRNPLDIVGIAGLSTFAWSSLGPTIGLRRGPDWLRLDRLGERIELGGHLEFVVRPLPSDRHPFQWIGPQRATTLAEIVEAVHAVTSDATMRQAAIVLLNAQLRAAEPAAVAALMKCSVKTIRNRASLAKFLLADDPAFPDLVSRAFGYLG